MADYEDRVSVLLRPALEAMGYELVGVQYHAGRQGLVRVYIDREEGITLDDCTLVSHQVSGILDVEDPIPGAYVLEVSSPGLDRPLFNPAHYERFIGAVVRLKLASPYQGRRRLKGELRGCRDGKVLVREAGGDYEVPLALVESARLVPEL